MAFGMLQKMLMKTLIFKEIRIMRTFDEFMLALDGSFNRVIPEEERDNITIDKVTVAKINDEILHGIVFRKTDVNEAPTFYVDQYFDDWQKGYIVSRTVAEEIYDMYKNLSVDAPIRSNEMDFDFETINDKISFRLVEEKRNKEFLKDKPYKSLDNGLAACFYIDVTDDYCFAINNGILEDMKVGVDSIYEKALDNVYHLDPPVLRDMQSALFSPDSENLLDRCKPVGLDERSGMYVLTNNKGAFGAGGMVHPDIMKRAAEVVGEDVFVLPSSLHEVILVPASSGMKLDDLAGMVKQANETVVEPRDVLSDEVYYYNLAEHRLECKTFEAESVVEEEEEFDI